MLHFLVVCMDVTASRRGNMVETMHASSCRPVWVINRVPDKGVVEGRLRSYLLRDRTGIRREVLRLFVTTRSLTIAELFEKLKKQFLVTFQAIASMVGTIASRIGILCATKTSDGVRTYGLKEKYVGIVIGIVGVG
ncbi:MAG: DUF2551 domain-containing protein [Methanoregula sp.]|nr:DUF2551 domain-containing protein [Methanoregula sp.]